MMGMGEPLANFDNVVAGAAPDARRQRLRPVAPARHAVDLGLVPLIDRLRDECPVALAVSLHAPQRRAARPPRADQPQASARELLAACLRYLDARAARLHHVRVRDARRRQRQPDARARAGRARARRAVQAQPDPVQSVSRQRVSRRARASASARSSSTLHGRRHRRRRCARRAATTSTPPAASSRARSRTAPSAGSRRAFRSPSRADTPFAHACDSRMNRLLPSLLLALAALRSPVARRTSRPPRRRRRSPTHAADQGAGSDAAAARGDRTPSSRAGYYERGQMDVALEELGDAREARSRRTRGIYNIYGLVYAMLGENAQGGAEFPAGARARAQRLRDPRKLGLVPVHARPAARVDAASSSMALRNPLYKTPEIALINAGKCSVAFGDDEEGRRISSAAR